MPKNALTINKGHIPWITKNIIIKDCLERSWFHDCNCYHIYKGYQDYQGNNGYIGYRHIVAISQIRKKKQEQGCEGHHISRWSP